MTMTEIPTADTFGAGEPSGKPQEVLLATILMLLNSLAGLIIGGAGLYFAEDWIYYYGEIGIVWAATSGIAVVLGVIGLWVTMGLWNLQNRAWTWAMIVNVIAIALYVTNWEYSLWGVAVSALVIFYLSIPRIKALYV
ncbi:MAG: hypothetical protein ACE5H4_10725 [Candidatus Thorarchaeota archaeon]